MARETHGWLKNEEPQWRPERHTGWLVVRLLHCVFALAAVVSLVNWNDFFPANGVPGKGRGAVMIANRGGLGLLKPFESALDKETLLFSAGFAPNQEVVELPAGYAQRIVNILEGHDKSFLVIEAHSDPMAYMRACKAQNPKAMNAIFNATQKLSAHRAEGVCEAIIAQANLGPEMRSRLIPVAVGVHDPYNGIENGIPVEPPTHDDWMKNLRVDVGIVSPEKALAMQLTN